MWAGQRGVAEAVSCSVDDQQRRWTLLLMLVLCMLLLLLCMMLLLWSMALLLLRMLLLMLILSMMLVLRVAPFVQHTVALQKGQSCEAMSVGQASTTRPGQTSAIYYYDQASDTSPG